MNIYLAKLQEKPIPNIKQKLGINVNLPHKKDEIEEEVKEEEPEIVEEDGADETKETEKVPMCQIMDGRKNAKLDRSNIIKNLKDKNLFSVKKRTMPKQMPDLPIEESEEKKEEEKEDTTIQLERPKKKNLIETAEMIEDDEDEPIEKPKKERVLKKPETRDIHNEKIDKNIEIDNIPLKTRLPKKEQLNMYTSSYYMNNRKKFISHLIPMFNKYKEELSNEDKIESCENQSTKKGDFNLMIHQRVVRDYLNLYTPYRGLLLYHGLGSGKTCTSIAIAEGMKSQKKIYVMTLASLKANFFDQMKVCGDPLYKLDQYWEFVSIDGKPDYIPILSNVLSLSRSYIEKRRGAWMVNVSKQSNFQDLNDEDRKALLLQIDEMIRAKYIDINYNGLNEDILNTYTHNNKINPFDNSVIIIDEVHNFVSMIVNKIKEKKKKSLPYKLYEYLMSATNAKIVLLSGTPIINYPNEIGIMFNILRGYIKTWSFNLQIKKAGNSFTKEDVVKWFDEAGLNQFDYVDLSGEKLTITRNPFGFVNKHRVERLKNVGGKKSQKKRNVGGKRSTKRRTNDVYSIKNGSISIENPLSDSSAYQNNETRIEESNALREVQQGGSVSSYNGVRLDESGNMSDKIFKQQIVSILEQHHIGTSLPSKVKAINNIALPDDSKEFLETFVELDSSEMKNKNVFQRRILGLTSYFKGANDNLYPTYVPSSEDPVYHFERVPMSNYQFGVYEKIRDKESKLEKNNRKKQAKQKGLGDAQEIFNTSSTYKIESRSCCNFAFPDPPGKPMKNKDELIGKPDQDEENDANENKMTGGEIEEDEEQPLEEMSEDEEDDEEEEDEEEKHKKIEILDDIVLHNIEDIEKDEKLTEEKESIQEEQFEVKPKKTKNTSKNDNNKRISDVLGELRTRKEEIFTPAGLKMYSPKFLRILENIQNVENRGLHLIYSQFRTLEGIALFKEVLETNGYAEFRIQKVQGGGNDWEIVEKEEDKGKPKFALHTGTETDEEKKILLNVYNSKWTEVPSSIVNKLQENNVENNFFGDAIKILMITASGAEGINLKNTRFVHIMEPYWNMVRPQQVIGRARRICSHQDLPQELRTVKVYLYMSVLSDEITSSDKHKNLRLRDVSKLTKKMEVNIDDTSMLGRYIRLLDNIPAVVTTDQILFERALQKDQVNSQILHAVKESSIDCTLYENKNENLVCYSFGQVRSNAFSSYPNIQKDIDNKDVVEIREKTVSYREFTYNGVVYVQNKQTLELYRKEDYKVAKEKGVTMYPIGKVVKDKNKKEKVIFY